jgi:hypothetical protein
VRLVFEEEAVGGQVQDAGRAALLLEPSFESDDVLPGANPQQSGDAFAFGTV